MRSQQRVSGHENRLKLTGDKVGSNLGNAVGKSMLSAVVPRTAKPRNRGVTMMIDKGLGLAETRDLLEMAADYIDFIKLGFGTALLYPPDALRRKVQMILDFGVAVLPGGTLLEVAFHQGTVPAFFDLARTVGFTCIEVSDGTVELPRSQRRELILRARDLGFNVLSEVGKKDPTRALEAGQALEQIVLDLDAGVDKVIIEARDSGRNIGIYDEQGRLRDQLFEDIVSGLDNWDGLDDVIWEAPQSSQQRALLARLGPHVNFGNVQPADVISLEAMRLGLRGDTLRLRLQATEGVWR